MFQTGGKPSTWFPPVGLVELYVLRIVFYNTPTKKIRQIKISIVLFQDAHTPQKQSSIVEKDFPCSRIACEDGCVNDKHVQAQVMKSRGAIGTGFMATRGKPSTWFPRE